MHAHRHQELQLDELLSPDVIAKLRRTLTRTPCRRIVIPGFTRAVTLVPILMRPKGPALVFTVRSARLPHHAGQVCFPGGRREASDRTLRDTALREAREELGIDPGRVAVLGRLDDVAIHTGFVIAPVVGWLRDPKPFRPDRREVRAVVELPLAELADPAHCRRRGSRPVAGRPHPMFEFRVRGVRVWGATARMVRDLLDMLDA